MSFHWILSIRKSPQISMTLSNISTDHNKTDVITLIFNLSYLPNPTARERYVNKVNVFKRSLTGLNSEFSFS